MRSVLSVIAVVIAAGLGWAGSAAGARAPTPEPGAASPPPAPAATSTISDRDRRLALNARLNEMLQTGEGARLTERARPARSASPLAQPRVSAPTPRSYAPQAQQTRSAELKPTELKPTGVMEPAATIAPPAVRTRQGVFNRAGLDLTTPPVIPRSDLECLTQAIYYEARSESEEGQAGVAEVVINRSKSGRYPREICQVVYQRNSRTCQFTFTCDGSIGRRPVIAQSWARAERIAREVLAGQGRARLPARSVNYHADYVRPSWGRRLERVRQIGAHIFYGASLNGREATPGAEQAPSRPASGLEFVRNSALERAYALVAGPAAGAAPAATPPGS